MNQQGFHIASLCFKGPGMPDAAVDFATGLSVVSGPSETGKSLIWEAINYVLGSSTPLKGIRERGHYDRILVEVHSYDGRVATLERSWNGGDLVLRDQPISELTEISPGRHLAARHDANNAETVSGFLLDLCSLSGKRLRTNNRGETRSLSFRDLIKLAMVSEERIIAKDSPIHSGDRNQRPTESSVFRMLLTDNDDSSVIAVRKPELVRVEEQGRQDVFVQLKARAQERIAAIGSSEEQLLAEAERLTVEINTIGALLEETTEGISQIEHRRAELWKLRQPLISRREQVESMLSRFSLLDEKYTSDIERLVSTQEAGNLLGEFEEGPCPLCGADPRNHNHEIFPGAEQLQYLTEACFAEITKIQKMQMDLAATTDRLAEEQVELSERISVLGAELDDVSNSLRTAIQPKLVSLRTNLASLTNSRRQIDSSVALFSEMRHLDELQFEIEAVHKQPKPTKASFATTPVDLLDEFSITVENVLDEWSYPDLSRVVFDAKKEDIIVSGQPKSDHGKGYRAILNAAFSVALMVFCRSHSLPHPGFVVLDSPLVTYREPDENIGDHLKDAFYEHLAKLGPDMQVIIMENIDPPKQTQNSIAYTHFTKNERVGRYGLLLPEVAEQPTRA